MSGHYDKLDRKTQTRHFANEFGNGKGDHRRIETTEQRERIRNNKFWQTCEFEKKKRESNKA